MSRGTSILLGCVAALVALPGYADQWRSPRMGVAVTQTEEASETSGETKARATKKKPPVIQTRAQVIVSPSPAQLRHMRTVSQESAEPTPDAPEEVAKGDYCQGGGCASSCGTSGCGSCGSCGDCGDCCCDCTPFWAHRSWLFGDYLYQKNFGPDMVHAVQFNTPAGVGAVGAVPFGRVGELTPQWQSAFRFGGELAVSCTSSISVAYTQFESHTTDFIAAPDAPAAGSVVSSVLLPGAADAGTTFSQAFAGYDIDYKLGDINFSRLVRGSDCSYLNADIGIRYGHLNQNFLQDAEFAQPNNPQLTGSTITFDGVGMRAGFDGRRRLGCGGLSAYGQGFFTAMFGRFHSSYAQLNTLTEELQGTANWQSDRVVPMIDYEVGLSWTSCSGRWRVSTGYNAAYWFNVVSTPGFIEAVQANDYHKVSDTLSFTGFVSRIEYQF